MFKGVNVYLTVFFYFLQESKLKEYGKFIYKMVILSASQGFASSDGQSYI